MFYLLVGVADLNEEDKQVRDQRVNQYSIFVSEDLVKEVYQVNRYLPTDEAKLTTLKELLRETAEKQYVDFNPDMPLDYGYIPTRRGFWFRNTATGISLPLPLDDLRNLRAVSGERKEQKQDFHWPWQRKK